ncbi:MAG: hypothetical protein V3W04_07065 [Gammaproteobacteria bacterium]
MHLLVDISGHGFGHLAQTAAVINALVAMDNSHQITIRSSLPEPLVRKKINSHFQYISCELDIGMIMYDALTVDADASYQWYQQFHVEYSRRVTFEASKLAELQVDLLFADIPYLSLDAAAARCIPSIVLCSLNWADIFDAYCHGRAEASAIYRQQVAAYAQAEQFLLPEPSMNMPQLENTRTIAAIAQPGR